MSNFEAMKQRAITGAIAAAAANIIDILAVRAREQLPVDRTYTRDEVAGLLHGMAEQVRAEAA